MKGLRKWIAPFAPDQSGAVEVFCELGGLIVICDAGGCAGNVCGFDEPRWFKKKSAIFSAGLRDMDAILGRDDRMVAKILSAVERIDCNFVAIIGTPVPSVIGTDYKALKRMIQKKVDIPVFIVDTNGTETYEAGVKKAYMELCHTFAREKFEKKEQILCVWGATPMDTQYLELPSIQKAYPEYDEILVIGMGTSYEDLKKIPLASKNLVVSVPGLAATTYLKQMCDIPYEIVYPMEWIPNFQDMAEIAENLKSNPSAQVLIVHQQILADAIRDEMFSNNVSTVWSWFAMDPDQMKEGDRQIHEEDEWMELVSKKQYDVIIADPILKRAIPQYKGIFIPLPHFAVSGTIYE